jgi:hypothetical protein
MQVILWLTTHRNDSHVRDIARISLQRQDSHTNVDRKQKPGVGMLAGLRLGKKLFFMNYGTETDVGGDATVRLRFNLSFTKPHQRLWISSVMTTAGNENKNTLRVPGKEFRHGHV